MRSLPQCPLFSYTFVCFSFLILFNYVSSKIDYTFSNNDSITPSSNRTIVSRNKMFELGFLKLDSKNGDDGRWYLGMWYKAMSKRDYVWVANRNNPLPDSTGVLKLSKTNFVIEDHFGTLVWSTNLSFPSPRPVVAELRDNGNFVLRYSTNDNNNPKAFLWQSFDYPTDTLLAEMKLGWDKASNLNRKLTSWKSEDDPSCGEYSYTIDIHGFPQRYLLKSDRVTHRSDPTWNRVDSSGIINTEQTNHVVFNFTTSAQEVTYSFTATEANIYFKLKVSYNGQVERWLSNPATKQWNLLWHSPSDVCDSYGKCEANSVCDMGMSLKCYCIKGFELKNEEVWKVLDMKSGCKRKTRLSCVGDGFLPLKKVKLPDTMTAIVDRTIGLKECRSRCLGDCNCTGYANMDSLNKGSGCLIWREELVDIRILSVVGQDLYVRLAASELEERSKSRNSMRWIVATTVIVLLLSFLILWFWKVNQKRATSVVISNTTALQLNRIDVSGETDEDLPLRMEFQTILMATNNFDHSCKLGEGGFGKVYKGRLPDGQEIAVKRLTEISEEGTNQFRNEVNLIAKLQHVNLDRLIGYSNDGDEHLLIYEYLENLSLSSYIFDTAQSIKLNGQKRLEIINGIARGIMYLHQDSRFKIIHRDLKASNILLDKDMIPKISDFGTARLIGREGSDAITREIKGTYGYMSPEYLNDGISSEKSDVFSFGVLLLEILTGKKNWRFKSVDGEMSLLIYVWKHWEAGTLLEILDPCIVDLSSPTFQTQVLRCFQIALSCVQLNVEDRPTMPSVVIMLGSEAAIPQPKPSSWYVPYIRKRPFGDTCSSSLTNQVSLITVIEPR